MPLLGAHVSTAGGVSLALKRAGEINCRSIQIFAKNNKCWTEGPIDPEEAGWFRAGLGKFGRENVVSHAGYLINLAAGNEEVYRKSVESMHEELCRAEDLGLGWVVLHPGSHGGRGEEWGIRRVSATLAKLLRKTKKFKVGILIETTAGQGNALGWRFEHLKAIRRRAGARGAPARIGVCVDTCHIFAAGYDIRTRRSYQATMDELDRQVGLKNVRAFHLNDSVKGFGSRVDRHEHIGKGEIGIDAFRYLLNDKRFSNLPMILETPKGPDMKEDVENLAVLRSLLRGAGRVSVSDAPSAGVPDAGRQPI